VVAAANADSKLLLTGCDDMHANLYDVHQGQLIDSFSGVVSGEGFGCERVSPGAAGLLPGTYTSFQRTQAAEAAEQHTTYACPPPPHTHTHSRHTAGHESWVLDVDVHPEGQVFATASSDAKVRGVSCGRWVVQSHHPWFARVTASAGLQAADCARVSFLRVHNLKTHRACCTPLPPPHTHTYTARAQR
jgi:WD40 repeat protein